MDMWINTTNQHSPQITNASRHIHFLPFVLFWVNTADCKNNLFHSAMWRSTWNWHRLHCDNPAINPESGIPDFYPGHFFLFFFIFFYCSSAGLSGGTFLSFFVMATSRWPSRGRWSLGGASLCSVEPRFARRDGLASLGGASLRSAGGLWKRYPLGRTLRGIAPAHRSVTHGVLWTSGVVPPEG